MRFMNGRRSYSSPEVEIVFFDAFGKASDIITTSVPDGWGTGGLDDGGWDEN